MDLNQNEIKKVLRAGKLLLIMGVILEIPCIILLIIGILDSIEGIFFIPVCIIPFLMIIEGIKYLKKPKDYISNFKSKNSYNKLKKNNFDCIKVEWNFEEALKVYCEMNNKEISQINSDDELKIWKYAGVNIAFLLIWIIENNFYISDEKEIEKYVDEVKKRNMTGSDFLSDICDEKLIRDEISEKIIDFIEDYFMNKGNHISGNYDDDYKIFVENILHKKLYSNEFSWSDYDKFKVNIDNAYKKFINMKKISNIK